MQLGRRESLQAFTRHRARSIQRGVDVGQRRDGGVPHRQRHLILGTDIAAQVSASCWFGIRRANAVGFLSCNADDRVAQE